MFHQTRMQKLYVDPASNSRGITQVFRTMYIKEGFGAYYRGMGAVVAGAGPAHALYFAAYERSKLLLGASADTPLATSLAAVSATVAHDLFMNPIDGA